MPRDNRASRQPYATDSSHVGYTPKAPAFWQDPDPTTVQQALDQLATRELGWTVATSDVGGIDRIS